jgi:septal ring factor EnvC (AmiA/AmiB activator)
MAAETTISEELSGKILAFVEHEAGRDPDFPPEDEAMVRELLATNPAARALADDFREVDIGLEGMFEAFGKIPVSDELMQRIQEQGEAFEARQKGEIAGKVVAFPPAQTERPRTYGFLAAAASLALMIAGAGLIYQFRAQQGLEQSVAELEAGRSEQASRIERLIAETGNLRGQLTAAIDAREETKTALSAVTDDAARLESKLATMTAARDEAQNTLASASASLAGLRASEAELEQQMATLESQSRTAAEQSAAEQEALQNQLADTQTELASVTDARRTAEAELAETSTTIEALRDEGAALSRQVAELQSETETLASEITTRTSELEGARAALAQAEQRTAELAAERLALTSQVDRSDRDLEETSTALAALDEEAAGLRRERDELAQAVDRLTAAVDQGESSLTTARAQLASAQQQSAAFETALETLRRQTGWLAQVAGYHIGYAGKPREVEVKAKEQRDEQALSKWLSSELGRPITIPRNLPMEGGLTFVGGRVLYTIDGQPIGQIAYHDSEGRLTAFYLKRNPTRATDAELKRAQFFGQLQIIHWQDEVFQYAVVGFADFGILEPVAAWLENNYGEDA